MNKDIIKEIIEMAEIQSDPRIICDWLKQYHPYEIAEAFTELPEDIRLSLYQAFTNEDLAEIISYIEPEKAADFFEEVANRQIAGIIEEMASDDATDILNNLDDDKRQAVINLLDQETRTDIENLALYSEDDAGSMMTTNYLTVESGKDVKDIMREIVRNAPEAETINTTFVIDKGGKLLGSLDLKKIIITKSPCPVDNIMDINFRYGNVDDNKEDIIKMIQNYDIDVLPVLEKGILKGIITGDDAMDSLVEEAEEDYARLGGLTESEELDEPTMISVKKRLPWLAILLIMNAFVAIIISAFDFLFTYESLTVLVIFQPIILNMAGNSGTQTLAITIQKITKKQLDNKNKIRKHLGKETIHGLSLGLTFGLLAFFLSAAILFLAKDFSIPVFKVSFIVAVSILISLTVANLSGALIPITFDKMKIDPAAASGPFITTVIDIIAILIYFTLATVLIYLQL
ncbi:MAG: magnesium transporter [Bacilli bacterium]|nr:magnesium transporter [Bacilli bacterium]